MFPLLLLTRMSKSYLKRIIEVNSQKYRSILYGVFQIALRGKGMVNFAGVIFIWWWESEE